MKWMPLQGAVSGPTSRQANDNGVAGGQLGPAGTTTTRRRARSCLRSKGPSAASPRAVPLAVVADGETVSPSTLFVHADHLDRPVHMTNASEALV